MKMMQKLVLHHRTRHIKYSVLTAAKHLLLSKFEPTLQTLSNCNPPLSSSYRTVTRQLFYDASSSFHQLSPFSFQPNMDLVFRLAEQKEEGVEDVTVDEWRQSGVSLFGVCSLFSKRGRPPPRPLISASSGKGLIASLPKVDSAPLPSASSASRPLSPT